MINDLAFVAASRASDYPGCSPEQALVYAVEDVVAETFAWRELNPEMLATFISDLSEVEGIDPPTIEHRRNCGRLVGSADAESRTISVRKNTSVGVVLHEVAHLTCASQTHGLAFRNDLVRLTRRYSDVEHAAMLHQIFRAAGLEMAPWMSAR